MPSEIKQILVKLKHEAHSPHSVKHWVCLSVDCV